MLVFNIVVGLIMAVSFIGMIICAKKQHVNNAAKPGAIALLLVVVACAVMILSKNMGGGSGAALLENELKYQKSQTYFLGKELAKQMPGASVLIVVGEKDPNTENKRQDALIAGLKEGFGNDITDIKIATPNVIKPKGPEFSEMPVEDLMKAKDFNALLIQNPNRQIVITMIGLPQDAANIKLWNDFARNPRTCQKLVMIGGDISRMAPFIVKGLMPVVVTHSPDALYTEASAPSDLKDCFDQRYLLITKDNIKDIITKYPDIIFRSK